MKLALLMTVAVMAVGCVVDQAPADDDRAEAVPNELASEDETSCTTHGHCEAGSFCHFEPGSCGGEGICTSTAMPKDVLATCMVPVCGCDGRDYASACDAWTDGVSVWHEGSCGTTEPDPEPSSCGGTTCASDEFCSYADGACGGAGTCTAMIGSCTSAASPVCGCNGITYSSRCSAMQAGVSIRHEGSC